MPAFGCAALLALFVAACGGPQHSVTEYEDVWKEAEGSAEKGDAEAPAENTAPAERKPCPDPNAQKGNPALGRVGDEEIDPVEAHHAAILEEYDTDGNKWLDKEELTTMYRLRAGTAFLEADTNRDGRLSVVEAAGACGEMSRGALEDLSLVDTDRDGFVSRFEFEAAVGSWIRTHEDYSKEALEDAIEKKRESGK